jgi:hypothetical protein
MIVTEQRVETQGNIKFADEVKMTFHESANGFLLNNLIKQYSDPYLAALREYTSNALDAHKAVGQTRPVEVSLPTALAPNLIIEDFGIGLTREELKGYGQFGASTKRDSNDYVGGFGLGSKSGLAMASQFSVTAVKDGKRNTVIVRRDESGAPSMGFLPEQDATGEENGVRVTIPTSERERFAKAIESNFFYGWEPGTILIDGEEPQVSIHDTDHYTPIGTDGWRSVKAASERSWNERHLIKALVGPVAYTLDMNKLVGDGVHVSWQGKEQFLRNVVVKVDNGSVTIHPSRESLIYDKPTREALAARLNALIAVGKGEHQKSIDAAHTARQAVLAMIRAEKEGFGGTYTYKGVTLDFKTAVTDDKVRDGRVWRANIVRSSRANSGLGTDQRYSTYASTVQSVGTVQSFYQNESVLVWGVEEPTNVDYKPKELSGAALFAEVDAQKNSLRATDYEVVFVMGKPSDYDKFFVNAFSQVINVADYAAVVKAERARLAAITRAANKAAGISGTGSRALGLKKDEVRVLRFAYNGLSDTVNTPVDELDSSRIHVLIKNGASSLSDMIRRTVLTQVNRVASIDTIMGYLNETGRYTFVIANANTNTDKYPELLPNYTTDIKAVVKSEGLAIKATISDFDKFLLSQSRSLGYFGERAQQFDDAQVASIEDAELRGFLSKVMGYQTRTKPAVNALRNFMNAAYAFGLNSHDFVLDGPSGFHSVPNFDKKYPMLAKTAGYYSYPDFPAQVVVDYVNMAYRASKGN